MLPRGLLEAMNTAKRPKAGPLRGLFEALGDTQRPEAGSSRGLLDEGSRGTSSPAAEPPPSGYTPQREPYYNPVERGAHLLLDNSDRLPSPLNLFVPLYRHGMY